MSMLCIIVYNASVCGVCTCMYVCLCVHACMRMCVCVHVRVYMHACMHMCVCVCACVHACMHAYVCPCMHACICVSMHACVCVCMSIMDEQVSPYSYIVDTHSIHVCIRITTEDKAWNCIEGTGDVYIAV